MGFLSDIKDKLFKAELPDKSSSEFASLFERTDLERLVNTINHHTELERRINRVGNRRDLEIIYFHDLEIFAAWEKRLSAIHNCNLEIVTESEELKQFFEDQLLPFEYDLKEDFMWAIPYGYSVQQIIYNPDRSGNVIGYQRENFWRFEPLKDLKHVILRTTGNITSSGDTNKVLPYGKWVLSTNKATTYNPFGDALFARLYIYWVMRCSDWDSWSKFIEKHGGSFFVGKTPNPEDVEALRTTLDKAMKSAAIAVTTEDEVSVSSSTNKGEGYKIFDDQIVNQYLRVILGETQTSKMEARGGSQSAQTHNEVRKEKTMSDARLIEKSFNETIRQIALVNGIDLVKTPVKAKISMAQGLENDRADRDVKLNSQGVKFTKKYYMEKYGLQEDEIEDEIGSEEPLLNFKQTSGLPIKLEDTPKSRKVINGQPKVDELIDLLLKSGISPLNNDDIIGAVRASTGVEDLESKLTALFEQDNTAFSEELAKTLYHAGILGAIDAVEKG